MKTFRITAFVVVLFILWTVAIYFIGKNRAPALVRETIVDTVVVRDTIRDTKLIPVDRYITRIDTVWLQIKGDTVRVEVEVPVERKTYQTEEYRAIIEGFLPTLVEMEIYQKTHYITRIETIKIPDKRKWGLGIQAGYGYNFNRFYPYVGIGLQYTLIGW